MKLFYFIYMCVCVCVCIYIYIYIYIYICTCESGYLFLHPTPYSLFTFGVVLSVMTIVIGNGIVNLSSNTGQDCLFFTLC